jgi:hypothetical protein
MKNVLTGLLFAFLAFVSVTCGRVTFNMSGANIGNAKTCQVNLFENRADIVNPILSAQITDALKDKIQSATSLKLVNSNADVSFEGEITGYNVQPQQITQNIAAKDRLTVTVKVRFTNELDDEKSYDKSFSRFQEYPGGESLSSHESQLVEDILKELMEDIFNEAFATW